MDAAAPTGTGIVASPPLRPWADLVFHVLAHVRRTAHLAPSVWDAAYVAFVERHAGPAEDRAIARDAEVIGQALADHDALARAQLLAWLFASVARGLAGAERDLGDLGEGDVDDAGAFARLRDAGPAVEVLRCAAALEAVAWSSLPPPDPDVRALGEALREAEGWAPAIARHRVAVVRSLRLRGRVRGREIWVGLPCGEPGPGIDHVVWQACHEATVAEVEAAAIGAGARDRSGVLWHRRVERAAIVLLAERAREAKRGREHARWIAHLGEGAPRLERSALPRQEASLVEACRQSAG